MSRLKTREAEFVAQVTQMTGNMSPGILNAAGIPTAEWDQVEAQLGNFTTQITGANAAREAAKTATASKDATGKALRARLQGFVDRIYAVPTITDAQLASISLPPRNGVVIPRPPVPVSNLTAKAGPLGQALLSWRRNGNTARTQFEIQISEGGLWQALATVVTTRFKDEITPLGLPRSYRVVAVNSLGRSLPSTSVSLFAAGEGDEGLNLAA